jgi:hypothetical protein
VTRVGFIICWFVHEMSDITDTLRAIISDFFLELCNATLIESCSRRSFCLFAVCGMVAFLVRGAGNCGGGGEEPQGWPRSVNYRLTHHSKTRKQTLNLVFSNEYSRNN